MKCPNCGRENEKDAKFCAVCGASMEKTEEQKEALNNGKKKKNRKRILIVISGVLVVVAVIAAGVWIITGKQVKKQYDQNLASGQKYLEELNYESAEDSYLKAIQIDPKEPEPYRKLIDTYVAQEKYDDAVKIARKAQKQVPKEERQEFEKLEQDYDSVIDYEWVIDPTVEADDIYYARMGVEEKKSENERRKQYNSNYAILQRDGRLALIDWKGELRTGMDYVWIKSGYLMEKNDKTGLSNYDAFYDDELHPNIITDLFDEKGQYIYYQDKLHNLAEWEGWDYEFEGPEQTIPVRDAEGTIDLSDPYSWWNLQQGKYGLYKDGKMITNFIYDECGSVSEGLIAVEKDGKWGYVDEKGKEIIPIEYDASWQQFENETHVATQDRSVVVTPFCYAASEGYIPLVKKEHWKLVDLSGKTVIPEGVFEKICPVYQGKCWVKKGGKWGVIQISKDSEITEKEEKSEKINIEEGDYEFASGDLLSGLYITEENGIKKCSLMFWHNYGAAMADEDFYFDWDEQKNTYRIQGNSSKNMFNITCTPIDSNSIKIDVICEEEYFDWKTGEKSKIWSGEIYKKTEEKEIQDWSVSEIGNAVANHYNVNNHCEDYVVFEEESTKTESGYEVIVRYQGGTQANVLVTLVSVDIETGKATDQSGETWYLQDEA